MKYRLFTLIELLVVIAIIAIPVDDLKFDIQRTPVIVKGNLCRARVVPVIEYSVWGPVKGGFADPTGFVPLRFDFE